MVKNHLKTIAVPKSWAVKRKEKKFILRPDAGSQSLHQSVSLHFVLTEFLGVTCTRKESIYLLRHKEVLVNGKKRKTISFSVGLMDVVSIPEIKKHVRIIINKKGKISAIDIDQKESSITLAKIVGKTQLKGKMQINLSNGMNILVDKDTYNVGDSVTVDVTKNTIKDHLKLAKGNSIFLTGGRHMGTIGIIEDILEGKIIYKSESKEVFETLKKYALVIGKEKGLITV